MSARLAQSGELAQVEIELIGSVDEPGVAIAVVISMLPPSPPAEETAASQDQAWQTSTGNGAGYGGGLRSNAAGHVRRG